MSSGRGGNERSNSADQESTSVAATPASAALPFRRLNRRYVAYLDHLRAQNGRRERRLATLLSLGTVALAVAIAVSRVRGYPYLAVALIGLMIGLAVRAALLWRGYRMQDRRNARLRSLVQDGVAVEAYLIQACSALFRAQDEPLPSLVLFTFQSEVAADADYLRHLARRVFSLKNTRQPDVDGRLLAGLTTEERGVRDRRRPLPLSFTDGSMIYCADLWIDPAHLRGGCLEGNVLTCIAEPGAAGGIELVPWWLLSDPDRPAATFEPEGAAGNRLA